MERIKFKILFSPAAQRDLEKLPPDKALQVANDTKAYLEDTPLPFGKTRIKKLSGFDPPLYRLRSGDFRAYYRILGRDVVLLAVTQRKDSKRILKQLR